MNSLLPMTPAERRTYDFVRGYHQKHGRPPTIRDVMTALEQKSPNAVASLYRRLLKKGWMKKNPGARGWVVSGMDGEVATDKEIAARKKAECRARAENCLATLLPQVAVLNPSGRRGRMCQALVAAFYLGASTCEPGIDFSVERDELVTKCGKLGD